MNVLFNRNDIKIGNQIEQPTTEEIKNTPQLWNASLEDALKYGGELTKSAIGAMNLRFDKKHIIVDTKIHMLMPGFYPAIPSWHTDGVPRGAELKPDGKGSPNIFAQEKMDASRFHLLVTGDGCLTDFVTTPTFIDIPEQADTNLYKLVHDEIEKRKDELEIVTTPSCTVVEWDWWNIHRAVKATKHEWRYLIRVTETDHMQPQSDLRQVLRTQIQIYVPESFGW